MVYWKLWAVIPLFIGTRDTKVKNANYEQEKTLLSIISIAFGILVFILYLAETGVSTVISFKFILGAVFGIAASLLYACIGFLVVRLYERLRSWAYKGEAQFLSNKQKLRLAAFWPITLFTYIFVYLFLGIINRNF